MDSCLGIPLTNHDNKCEDVIQHDPKWRGEILEAVEIRALHYRIGHRLQNEPRHSTVVIDLIHSDKSLEKAHDDDGEEGEEDEGLLHHDFEDDKHGAEEADVVKVQKEAEVEHWSAEG